jgi:molybdopterin-guanine dinucleotide biosynthesis protein A
MVREEMRKIDAWTARYKVAVAEWPTDPVDPFFNANKPEDLAAAEEMAREVG